MDDIELKPDLTGHRRPAAERGANPFLVRSERLRTAIPRPTLIRRWLQREKHDDRRGRPEPSIRPQTTGASTQYTRGGPRRASVAHLGYLRQERQEQHQPPPQGQGPAEPSPGEVDGREDWKADDEASRLHPRHDEPRFRPGCQLR